jgi:hypothetical protein
MFKRFAVLSALLLGTLTLAHATPIAGTIAISGNDSFTSSTITFFNPATIGGTSTGTFSVLTNGNAVTMFPGFSGPLTYSLGQNTVPAGISPVLVLSTTEGGITFDFYMTDYSAMLVSNIIGCGSATCLDVTGNGFFSATGYTDTPGTFTFTTQEVTGQTNTTFSASGIAATPEPASLALVGSGILGLAGLARRRFSF